MKQVIILSLAIFLSMNCSNKKKDGLWLLFGLLGSGNTDSAAASTATNAPDGSKVEQIDENTSVIHLPVAQAESTESNEESANSESSDSGTPAFQPTTVTTNNQDVIGNSDFVFQTNSTVPISIQVNDDNGPVAGAIVTILDPSDETNPDILFQQTTDTTGTASGSIIVSNGVTSVVANINLGNEIVTTTIPTTATNPTTGQQADVLAIDRDVVVSGSHNPTQFFADNDGDGIENSSDDYPDDPTRATMTRFPKAGVNTIAFEDLFPNAGDADLNDYVLFFNTEEDLNAQGKIVKLRGSYQHVARGAGYRHTLNLKLNAGTGATVTKVIYDDKGKTLNNKGEVTLNLSSADLSKGFELLPESNTTLSTPNNNAAHANNLKFGYTVSFEITFNEPVTRAALGNSPYDIYIYVVNTKKFIHLPGKYFDANGKDSFLDATGFPWAIIVPGKWKWPLEGNDIRNASKTGYAEFNTWATSKGSLNKTWYNNVSDPSKVFPLPDDSNLAGYLAKAAEENWLLVAMLLLISGLSIGYFLTRRNNGHLSN
ncbi:MAG: LruC domain-containing protein [Leptospiraceae bacterium]|nr:LruC domain-containing protein [Leptospiraceae bacterium]